MGNFIFSDRFIPISKDNYIATIENIRNGDNLLEQLSEKLKFPNYFGNNWDALNDCLGDLNWIDQRNIIIVHRTPIQLSKDEISIYIRILTRSMNEWLKWHDGTIHQLEVVFPKNCQRQIETYIEQADLFYELQSNRLNFK